MRMRVISAIFDFFIVLSIAPYKLSNDGSYKFSRILTQTYVISILKLRMRLTSAILIFFMVLSYCPLKTVQWSFFISLAEF